MGFFSTETRDVKEIKNISSYLKKLSGKYLLLIAGDEKITCDELSIRRLLTISEKKQAGITYSDFIRQEGKNFISQPLIDYQPGSIRDDFNFGHLLIFSCGVVQSVLQKYGALPSEEDAALYDLRLKISTDHELIHVPEFFIHGINKKAQEDKKIRQASRGSLRLRCKREFYPSEKVREDRDKSSETHRGVSASAHKKNKKRTGCSPMEGEHRRSST